jgi:PEP-CTERM motif
VPFIPVASSVSVDSLSSTTTVHWTFPNITVPKGMKFTENFAILNQQGQLIDFYGDLPSSQTSMDLGNLPKTSTTSGNPTTIPLRSGQGYEILIDGSLDGLVNGVQYSESISYNSFTPSSTSASFAGPVYTPDVVTNGGVTTDMFNIAVSAGETYNIDPALAHGFIYKIGAGDPNFATVELPGIGNLNDYALYVFEGGKWVFDADLAADTVFGFGPGGVSEFEVLGINPGLDASNGNAFVTQVSFVGGGSFTGTMTAVVPEPSTWAMMLLGFAGLGWAGYRGRVMRITGRGA